jgi:hypothetical protein
MIYRSRDILQRVKAAPFVPFRIHTTSNRMHEVRHPELVMVTPSFVLVGVPRPNYAETGVIDSFVQVALMHISEIEPVGDSSPPQTGGGTAVPA